ncbi:MAG TPA: hypothetical protein VF783_13920 [Terriglobales bacterium]
MNKERLTQLSTLLRELSPTNPVGFDQTRWYCGTSADAIGHACLSRLFTDQGLRLQHNGFDWEPTYEGMGGWEAVEAFFELSSAEAERLFYEYPNPVDTTPADVADRIDELLATVEA